MMFYDLDVYIFYISDHKLGICLRILRLSKGLQHNWGYYVRTLLLICGGGYHEDDAQTFFFFFSSVSVSVCVFNVWHETTLFFQCGLRDTKRLDTPALDILTSSTYTELAH